MSILNNWWGMNAPTYTSPEQELFLQQQALMNNQQGMYMTGRMPTRKEKVDFLRATFNASDVVLVDEFEALTLKHICVGGNIIYLLNKSTFNLQTPQGVLCVEYFFCSVCRKLYINKCTLE